jgi:imidazolonepropionase-like amidohydrolase
MATLYVGGRLFDGEKVQDGHAVLEEGGKVKRVAPTAEFAGFAGEKVDTAGGTLIPGMIDCHVHSLVGGAARGARHGVHAQHAGRRHHRRA